MSHDVITISDFSREDMENLVQEGLVVKLRGRTKYFGKKLASCFFENSTRTRESTEEAAMALWMKKFGFSSVEGTSVKKGEPLADTMRMYAGYGADIMAIRHPLEGSARFTADVLDIPVINCGDGSHAHPTQTLIDLMTIKERRGNLKGLKVAIVGDLKYGRTVHSLLAALIKLEAKEVHMVSPPELKLPEWLLRETGSTITYETTNLSHVIPRVDVLYMTRIQRERFPKQMTEADFERLAQGFRLSEDLLRPHKDLLVLHPLPRYKERLEIPMEIDKMPQAGYLTQASNGLFMRQAILARALGPGFETEERKKIETDVLDELPLTQKAREGYGGIYTLRHGTLIDHLEPGLGEQIVKLLNLKEMNSTYFMAAHIKSTKHDYKDVVGIPDQFLSEHELYKLGILSRHARINRIENGTVTNKWSVRPPSVLEGVISCPNDGCISYPESYEHAPSIFYLANADELLCHYCERPVKRDDIVL